MSYLPELPPLIPFPNDGGFQELDLFPLLHQIDERIERFQSILIPKEVRSTKPDPKEGEDIPLIKSRRGKREKSPVPLLYPDGEIFDQIDQFFNLKKPVPKKKILKNKTVFKAVNKRPSLIPIENIRIPKIDPLPPLVIRSFCEEMSENKKYKEFFFRSQFYLLNDDIEVLECIAKLKNDDILLFDDYFKKRGWNLKILTLIDNNISKIQNFQNIPTLIQLNLLKNLIKEIPDFTGFPTLETLVLSDNRLRQIPNFTCLSTLLTLDVKGNRLQEIPDFSSFPNLTTLDLSRNILEDFPTFTRLSTLKILNLSENKLSTMPDLIGLPNLKTLDVSWNRLKMIPDLTHLPELETLFLKENMLIKVPDFSHLPALKILDLSLNLLTIVTDFTSLPSLKELNLAGNPIAFLPEFTHLTALATLKLKQKQKKLLSKNQHKFSVLLI